MTSRLRSARNGVGSWCVGSSRLERRVRSAAAEGFKTGPHLAPVASRGRAGSSAAAWCARLAGDGGGRTRTPLESKPEQ